VKIHIQLPAVLAQRIEERISRDGSATSVADFLRQAAVKELERQDLNNSAEIESKAPTRAKTPTNPVRDS
jgi:Arc/MetJ-type ribon-helix-helix transcriptional regulator